MSKLLFSLNKNDFTIQTFRCAGPGGQNVNKRDTGVRIIHKASGAVGKSTEERSQDQNKKIAFKRLTETIEFRRWINEKVFEINNNKTIEQKVEEEMKDENIKIEIKNNGKWEVIDKIEEEK